MNIARSLIILLGSCLSAYQNSKGNGKEIRRRVLLTALWFFSEQLMPLRAWMGSRDDNGDVAEFRDVTELFKLLTDLFRYGLPSPFSRLPSLDYCGLPDPL